MKDVFPPGTSAALIVAAIMGGVLSSVLNWEGVWPTVRKLIIGVIMTIYFGALGVPLIGWILTPFGLPAEATPLTSGFLIGMLGIIIAETVFKIAKLKLGGLPKEIDDETHP